MTDRAGGAMPREGPMTSNLIARAFAAVAHREVAPSPGWRERWLATTTLVLAALFTGVGMLSETGVAAPVIGRNDTRDHEQTPALAVTASPPSTTPRPRTASLDGGDWRAVSHDLDVHDAPEHDERPQAPAQRPSGDGRDAPDPFILQDGGKYVLYTTQVGLQSVPMATSRDLVHWSESRDALPTL